MWISGGGRIPLGWTEVRPLARYGSHATCPRRGRRHHATVTTGKSWAAPQQKYTGTQQRRVCDTTHWSLDSDRRYRNGSVLSNQSSPGKIHRQYARERPAGDYL